MKIALIDDEETWRTIIYKKIKAYFPDDEIQIFASGEDFLQKEQIFEIVFVDIEMGGIDGFETAIEYGAYSTDSVIMILTTHREMVKRGYAVNAFRYLDKVNMDDELEEAVFAVKKKLEKNRKIHVPVVGLGEKIFELKEIVYVETEKRNICIHTWNEKFYSNLGMAEMEEILGAAFYRCHRSFIVNLDMVRQIHRMNLELKNGENVFLSVRKSAEFKKKYLNWKYEHANA